MKRALAMVLAVTLFFSFAVVGQAAALEGSPLGGLISFMGSRVQAHTVSGSWPLIGTTDSFTVDVPTDRLIFWCEPRTNFISPLSDYRLQMTFDSPFAPDEFVVEYLDTNGDTHSFLLPMSGIVFANGVVDVDVLFSPSVLGTLKTVTFRYNTNTITSFTGGVYEFTCTNVDVAADFEGGFGSVYTPNSLEIYYSLSAGSDDVTGSVGGLFQIPIVNIANQYNGNNLQVVVKKPSGSSDYLDGLFSSVERFYFVFEAFTDAASDLFYSDLSGYNPNSGNFDVQQLSSNRVRVSGYVEKSVSTPLSFFFNVATNNTGNLYFVVEEFVCIPVYALSDYPSFVTGDNGSAGFFKDLFGDLYNGLIGFFISQENADESVYEEAADPVLGENTETAKEQVEAVGQVESEVFGQLDSYSSTIDPSAVETPSSLVSSMGFISLMWTDFFNVLPGDYQFVFTFPLFLGLSLLIIGRGSQAYIRGVRVHREKGKDD